jgi:phosphoglycerol transferase
LIFLVILGGLLQAVSLFNPRQAARVFLFAFLPIVVVLGDISTTFKIQLAYQGDVYDKAARAARQLLPASQLGQGIVVGENLWALFRSLFQLDSPTTKIRILSDGASIESGTVGEDRTWALIMGDHSLKIPYAAKISLKGASLVAFRPGLLQVASQPSDSPLQLSFDAEVVPGTGFHVFDGQCTWSRTASPIIELPTEVAGSLRITVSAYGFGPNANRRVQLSLGSGAAEVVLPAQLTDIEARMVVEAPARELKVTGLHPLSPAVLAGSPDTRSLGMCLRSLSIQAEKASVP